MAQSGREKPVRGGAWWGPEQPSEGVLRTQGSGQWSVSCTWLLPRVSPPGLLSLSGLGCHPSGLCACGSTPRPGRGYYWGKGICALGPEVRPAPREGLATCMALPWPWSQRLVDMFSTTNMRVLATWETSKTASVQRKLEMPILLWALDPEVGLWELSAAGQCRVWAAPGRQVALRVVTRRGGTRHTCSPCTAPSLCWPTGSPAISLSLISLGECTPLVTLWVFWDRCLASPEHHSVWTLASPLCFSAGELAHYSSSWRAQAPHPCQCPLLGHQWKTASWYNPIVLVKGLE